MRIEKALDQNLKTILDTDLIIFAIGDDTVERRINAVLNFRIPRIHVWLEPLGLGGHVLSIGLKGQAGCFDCLFSRHADGSLMNLANLAASNQDFQRSCGGCAGTFTPFGSMDAQRAATEAVRESIRLLTVSQAKPALVTWASSRKLFLDSEFRLSRRGEKLQDGHMLVVDDFSRPDCPVCRDIE
jgi:hypothetical protein